MEARDPYLPPQASHHSDTPTAASSNPAMRDDSPPRTPTAHKGKAPMLDTHYHHHDTTFFDDDTPVDKRRSGATELSVWSRDSHDLHFRDVTRESVVDNMLLSLDSLSHAPTTFPSHFGGGMYSGFHDDDDDDDEQYQSSVMHFSPPPHFRAQHPEYESHDESFGRFSTPQTRSRRSNSTTNFRTDLDRIESMGSRGYGSARMSSDTTRKPLYGEGIVAQHSRGGGRKGSKGSSSSSMDYGYSTQIIPPGSRRTNRSSSFDNGYDHRSFRNDMSPTSPYDSVLNRGRPNVFEYPSYDAAPTPTIPTGMRSRYGDPPPSAPGFDYGSQQSAFGSLPVHVPAVPAPSSRRNSIRSSSSKGPWNGKARGPDASIRAQASEFVNAINIRELPPIPAFADSTPSKPSTPQSTAPPKQERRGFFSRVFGGGRNQTTQEPRGPPQHPSFDIRSPEQAKRPSTTPAQQNNPPSLPKGAERQGSIPSAEPQPIKTLTKKNSSFFRRRKKSVTEEPPPPPMPMQVQRMADIGSSMLTSPSASSLRNAMKDYLGDQQTASPRDMYYDTQETQSPIDDGNEHVGGFSPQYTPHRDATIRTVEPGSRATDDSVAPAVEGVQQKYKLKVKRGKGASAWANDDSSFLADSSEHEDMSGDLSTPEKGQMYVPEQARRPATSPTSSSVIHHTPSGKQKANVGEKRIEPHSYSSDKAFTDGGEGEEDGWVITTPPNKESSGHDVNGRNNRVWLEPTSSEEKLDEPTSLSLPLEGAKSSLKNQQSPADQYSPNTPSDAYHSALSLPIVQVEGGDVRTSAEVERTTPVPVSEEPTEEDREKAQQIYDGDESFVSKARAAAFLGEKTLASTRCRKAYMEIYEWTGFSVLLAMRDLCNRLVLKGETQEVDRVLDSFANRWCECNPNHGFKSSGAVHTICYSVLLLNTDLHMADIEQKMTRGQFVKNTLPTIRRVVDAENEEATDNERNTYSRSATPMNDPISPGDDHVNRPSMDLNTKRSRNRLSIRPAMGLRTDSDGFPSNPDSGTGDSCTVLVKAPFEGSMKAWEYQLEIVLKEFYNSIKTSKLPLHGVNETTPVQSSANLSVGGVLRRTPSVLSKAPSDTTSHRGRHSEFRAATARWNSKTRSRPKLYPNSTIGSSRTSLDDQSVFSPAGSSKWSSYSVGKTGTSMSVDSLGSHFVPPDYQQSIGFANALSQAIIREGNEENHTIASCEEFGRTAPLLEDESLELHGPPWAKEGILKHKHHLEALDKKFKDRNWNEVFAVIEKGYMKIFTFNMNAKSMRSKAKRRPSTSGGVVGGGNWADNAEELHSFLLRQVLATPLPPPGYSKTRPHVFALSLPTGAVHLFQAGTADIVREYVQTANYWSARLSKEPLVGGVSNIEYGWGDGVINTALIGRPESSPTGNSGSMPRRPSIQNSIRSSMDHGTIKARLPGDKVTLSDWTPPAQSMMASNLMEVDQHKALSAYIKNVEDELSRHQELRAPMMIAFSPRHPNAAKAMANFEKKASYLLRELVKFKTYLDALNYANDTRDKIYKEREERLQAEEAKEEADKEAAEAGKDEDDMSEPDIPSAAGQHLLSAFDPPEN